MKKSIKKKTTLIYIHGKDGNVGEIELYKNFFPKCEALGFDYKSQTPWEAVEEFKEYFNDISKRYNSIILIANSIGAFFAMSAIGNVQIEKAIFISPIVNMEKLIVDMMQWAGVTETELKEKQFIETSFGEVLSWEYLSWVRNHPIQWNIPTYILYGSADNLQSIETINAFVNTINANLTVMDNGEHWFHTDKQIEFLEQWILSLEK